MSYTNTLPFIRRRRLSGSVVSGIILAQRALNFAATFLRASGSPSYDGAAQLTSVAVNAPAFTRFGNLAVDLPVTNLVQNPNFVGLVAGTPGTVPTRASITAAANGVVIEQLSAAVNGNGEPEWRFRVSAASALTTSFRPFFRPENAGIPVVPRLSCLGRFDVRLIEGSVPAQVTTRLQMQERTGLTFLNKVTGDPVEGSTTTSDVDAKVLTSDAQRFQMIMAGYKDTAIGSTATVDNLDFAFVMDMPVGTPAFSCVIGLANPVAVTGAAATAANPLRPAAGATGVTTRAGDSVTFPLSAFSIQNTAEISGFIDCVLPNVENRDRELISFETADGQDGFGIHLREFTAMPRPRITVAGVDKTGATSGVIYLGGLVRVGFVYRSGMLGVCLGASAFGVNGGPVAWLDASTTARALDVIRLRASSIHYRQIWVVGRAIQTTDLQAVCAAGPGTPINDLLPAASGPLDRGTGENIANSLLRPAVMYSPNGGHMNDPHGMVMLPDGSEDICFQSVPSHSQDNITEAVQNGATKAWGRITSTDGLRFTQQRLMLLPNPGYIDRNGIWSGARFKRPDGKWMCFHTSVGKAEASWWEESDNVGGPYTRSLVPYFMKAGLPYGANTSRDPSIPILEGDGYYYQVLACQKSDNSGSAITLERTNDATLRTGWTYYGDALLSTATGFLPTGNAAANVVECPARWKQNSKTWILYSTSSQSWLVLGTDNASFQLAIEQGLCVDRGGAYASAVYFATDNTARLRHWLVPRVPGDRFAVNKARGWAGVLSLPFRPYLDGSNKLRIGLDSRVDSLRNSVVTFTGGQLQNGMTLVTSPTPQLEAVVTALATQAVTLNVNNGDGTVMASVVYDPAAATGQRLNWNAVGASINNIAAPLTLPAGEDLSIRMLVDGGKVIVIVNDLERCTIDTYPAAQAPFSITCPQGASLKTAMGCKLTPTSPDRYTSDNVQSLGKV